MRILQHHPALTILEEPFNEHFTEWSAENPDYRGRVHDASSFDGVVAEILSRHTGLKVLGYQLPDELIARLVTGPDRRILFLRRRNLLQAVVSVLIAEQTGVWKKWEMTRPLEEHYRDLRPLDTDEVRERIGVLREQLAYYETIVDALPSGSAMKLVYEELYYAPPAERERQVDRIWDWLDLPSIDPEPIRRYLDPDSARINSDATYALLPNARRIDALCGCDETGWLFRRTT